MHSSPEKGNTNITDEKITTDKIINQNELQIKAYQISHYIMK